MVSPTEIRRPFIAECRTLRTVLHVSAVCASVSSCFTHFSSSLYHALKFTTLVGLKELFLGEMYCPDKETLNEKRSSRAEAGWMINSHELVALSRSLPGDYRDEEIRVMRPDSPDSPVTRNIACTEDTWND